MRTLSYIFMLIINSILFAEEFSVETEIKGRKEVMLQCVKCHGVSHRASLTFKTRAHQEKYWAVQNKISATDFLRKERMQYFQNNAKQLIDTHRNTKASTYFDSNRFQEYRIYIENVYNGQGNRIEHTYKVKGQKLYLKKCKKCHGQMIGYTSKHYSNEFKKYFDDTKLIIKIHQETNASKFFDSEKFKSNSQYIKYALTTNAYDTYEGCRAAGAGWPEPDNKYEEMR